MMLSLYTVVMEVTLVNDYYSLAIHLLLCFPTVNIPKLTILQISRHTVVCRAAQEARGACKRERVY